MNMTFIKFVFIYVFVSCFINDDSNHVQAQSILKNGVSCVDKKRIINGHNSMRRRLAKGQIKGQPKAANLQKIVWSDQIAVTAQNYANKMTGQNHNQNRGSVGENLFTQQNTNSNNVPDWNAALKKWFNEYTVYKYGPLVSDPKTGHYTQMAWADTMYVGCGFGFAKIGKWYTKQYVCNYGPAGNVLGKAPYKIGAGCENLCCKNQCANTYGNKCK